MMVRVLLSVLGSAMAAAGLVGIISPKLMQNRKTGEIHTRGTWAASLFLGLVMLGGDSLLTGDDDKAKQPAADTQAETLQADDSASNPTSEKGYDLTINTPKKSCPSALKSCANGSIVKWRFLITLKPSLSRKMPSPPARKTRSILFISIPPPKA